MFIETVPNRNSPPAILLRESWREGKKVHKRTVANLSKMPPHLIEGLRALLEGGTVVGVGEGGGLEVVRSLPHGHVAAGLGMVRQIALDRLLLSTAKDEASLRHCELVVAMIVDRLVAPRSKLGFVRAVDTETACTSLGSVLGLGSVAEAEAYAALDWLLTQQPRIEKALARRHLRDGTLVLYDVSSSYFEGRKCPLARMGYSRDHRADRPQIVYGVLCTRAGLPVAVEVFEGNTADPATLADQVIKLKQRFALERVVLVGDRGMITQARIREDLAPAGLDWISCLRGPDIRELAAADGPLQLSLFDDRDLAEISDPRYPGERLIVCRNPHLAADRARKREELLQATEQDLARIAARVQRRRRKVMSATDIGLAVGAVLGRKKMAKHFVLDIAEGRLSWSRNPETIARETRLDGIYVVRTNVPADHLDCAETVQAYKDLGRVERAFRCLKTVDLEIRPVRHWVAPRVRAHVFLCMLAYHVEWHLRTRLAPLLFHDTEVEAARAARASPVARTEPSPDAKAKKAFKRNAKGFRVMGFAELLGHLGTLTRNALAMPIQSPAATGDHAGHAITVHSTPTALQKEAFDLLGIDPVRVQ
jgi:hypothetical protein